MVENVRHAAGQTTYEVREILEGDPALDLGVRFESADFGAALDFAFDFLEKRDPRREGAVGGLEIAFLVGVTLGAAARRIPLLLDGFVSSVAGLVAIGFQESAAASLIAATRSPEPGHALVLRRLGLEPLLDLGLRLGEGTGAALALPLVRSAIAILTDMATFDAAGVDGPAAAVAPRLAAGDA